MLRNIKQKKELDNPRVREKLEIERRYWSKYGVDWKLITEDEVNYQKARNIEWLYSTAGLRECESKGRLHRFPDIKGFINEVVESKEEWLRCRITAIAEKKKWMGDI